MSPFVDISWRALLALQSGTHPHATVTLGFLPTDVQHILFEMTWYLNLDNGQLIVLYSETNEQKTNRSYRIKSHGLRCKIEFPLLKLHSLALLISAEIKAVNLSELPMISHVGQTVFIESISIHRSGRGLSTCFIFSTSLERKNELKSTKSSL